jgi:hypothetical protein
MDSDAQFVDVDPKTLLELIYMLHEN